MSKGYWKWSEGDYVGGMITSSKPGRVSRILHKILLGWEWVELNKKDSYGNNVYRFDGSDTYIDIGGS